MGFYGVLVGAANGIVAITVGLSLPFNDVSDGLEQIHLRLNILGFLWLTNIGIAYQFYPSAVGTLPGASNSIALTSITSIGIGLLTQVIGLIGQVPVIVTLGELVALAGVLLYTYLLVAVFRPR